MDWIITLFALTLLTSTSTLSYLTGKKVEHKHTQRTRNLCEQVIQIQADEINQKNVMIASKGTWRLL